MRVAWDLQAVTGPKPTGLGIAVRLLLDAARQHAPGLELVGLAPNTTDAPLRGVPDRLLWEQWRLPLAVRQAHRRAPLALLFSPALGAPLRACVPVVAHVNDLIPLRYPGQFRGAAGWYWERLLPQTWRKCRALTTSNDAMADEIASTLPYPRRRIFVVPYYADPRWQAAALTIDPEFHAIDMSDVPPEPCFVMLASHEPRKNIELSLQALGLLRQRGTAAKLLCIGGTTTHTAVLRQLCLKYGISDLVEFPGYLDQSGIAAALLSCTALLFVSRYEGYGLPPQEAQSVGCAVVLSDISCHRAVYHDPQRWNQVTPLLRQPPPLVPPDDAEQLAQTMARLINDGAYRCSLRQAGLAYQATFSAQQTAEALEQAFRLAPV